MASQYRTQCNDIVIIVRHVHFCVNTACLMVCTASLMYSCLGYCKTHLVQMLPFFLVYNLLLSLTLWHDIFLSPCSPDTDRANHNTLQIFATGKSTFLKFRALTRKQTEKERFHVELMPKRKKASQLSMQATLGVFNGSRL